jgi:lipoate-protein ligase A
MIEARGISTVRRPTGGRAVWHARELTYAVAAPVSTFGDDPTRVVSHNAFTAIHTMLLLAVRKLGVSVSMAPCKAATRLGGSASRSRAAVPPSRLDAGACFANSVGGELEVGGRKILGSAQVMQGNAFLQHGSLLLEDDQQAVADLTLGERVRSSETTLRQVTGREISFDEASAAIASAARIWDGDWRAWAGPAEEELVGSGAKFRDPDWTWRR